MYLILAVLMLFTLTESVVRITASTQNTEVGGPIISDTMWTHVNSPYLVTENLEVWEDVTLTIEPGVVVRFDTAKKLQVRGTLVARGTASSPIVFTSNQTEPSAGDWGQIEFTDTSVDATFDSDGNYVSGSIVQNCIVEFAVYFPLDVPEGDAGAVQTSSASPLIDNCLFRENKMYDISASGTEGDPVFVTNNTVLGAPDSPGSQETAVGGIHATHAVISGNTIDGFRLAGITAARSVISKNLVQNSGTGIQGRNSTISENVVRNNSYSGITGPHLTILDNLIVGNGGHGIRVDIFTTIVGNTIRGNGPVDRGGGIWTEVEVYGSIENNIIEGNMAGDGGGIRASGVLPVIGNIIVGNMASEIGGGIIGGGPVTHNTIAFNTSGRQGAGAHYPVSSFEYNTVVGNRVTSQEVGMGAVALPGATSLHFNNLHDNEPHDVVVLGGGDVSGENNYWGTTESVNILQQVYDWYDDTSRGRLLYIPYLQEPDPAAPVPPPLNISAEFSDDSLTVQWDPLPSTTTGYGYKVYYDTDEPFAPYDGKGLAQGDSPVDVGSSAMLSLTGLNDDIYYVAVTAYDTLGRESWYSLPVTVDPATQDETYLPLILQGD